MHYRWAHALFRETLYADLPATERRALHARVALALELQYGPRAPEHAAELAEHFAHSPDRDDLGKALVYSRQAAAQATAVYADSEAARLLERHSRFRRPLPQTTVRSGVTCSRLGAGRSTTRASRVERSTRSPRLAFARGRSAWRSRACFGRVSAGHGLPRQHCLLACHLDTRRRLVGRTSRPLGATRNDGSRVRRHVPRRAGLLSRALVSTASRSYAARSSWPADSTTLRQLWWAAAMWMAYAQAPQHADAVLRLAEEFTESADGRCQHARGDPCADVGGGALLVPRPAPSRRAGLAGVGRSGGAPWATHCAPGRWSLTGRARDSRRPPGGSGRPRGTDGGLRPRGRASRLRASSIAASPTSAPCSIWDGTTRQLHEVSTAPARVLARAYLGQAAEVRAHLDEFVLARAALRHPGGRDTRLHGRVPPGGRDPGGAPRRGRAAARSIGV